MAAIASAAAAPAGAGPSAMAHHLAQFRRRFDEHNGGPRGPAEEAREAVAADVRVHGLPPRRGSTGAARAPAAQQVSDVSAGATGTTLRGVER